MDSPGPRLSIMQRMLDLTKDEALRDLTLSVSGEDFKVHKFVMAASSQKLHKMIAEMHSCKDDKSSVLHIDGISANGMKLILLYIYSGTLPDLANTNDIAELTHAANVLEVEVRGLTETDESDSSDQEQHITEVEMNIPEICIEVDIGTYPRNLDDTTHVNDNIIDDSDLVEYELPMLGSPSQRRARYNRGPSGSMPGPYKFENTERDTRPPKSKVLIQIVGNKTSDEYFPSGMDKESSDDDADLTPYHKRTVTSKGSLRKGCKTVETKVAHKNSKSGILIKGVDISKLYTTTERDGSTLRKAPTMPNPALSLKRGRPRLPNDYLFPNSPPYLCPHVNCTKECDTREKLKKHYRSHDERNHKCDTCHKKFLYQKDLICHLRTHTGEKPFKCEVCGKGFSQKATLQYHSKMHDDARIEYFCEQCGKHYKALKSLQNHVERCHGIESDKFDMHDTGLLQNPVMCPVCAVRFKNYISMYHHVKRKHPDSEEIKFMPKVRSQRKTLKNCASTPDGMKNIIDQVKHEISPQETTIDYSNDTTSTSFFCMSCSLSFKDEATFMKHVKKCDKEAIRLIFMCGYCKQCFDSEELREQHTGACHKNQGKVLELENDVVAAHVNADNLGSVSILNLENVF